MKRPINVIKVPITSCLVIPSLLIKYANKRTKTGSVVPNTDTNDTEISLIATIDKRKPP